jgi:hypothetical protein
VNLYSGMKNKSARRHQARERNLKLTGVPADLNNPASVDTDPFVPLVAVAAELRLAVDCCLIIF